MKTEAVILPSNHHLALGRLNTMFHQRYLQYFIKYNEVIKQKLLKNMIEKVDVIDKLMIVNITYLIKQLLCQIKVQ